MSDEKELHDWIGEFNQLQVEWQESRVASGRFDQIIIDLRKYGFSLITFLITASGIALQNSLVTNAWSSVTVPSAIMILICGLFLADRYHEVLLLGCILRSRQLEDVSNELLDAGARNSIYTRINLTTFIEDKIQKARARTFSFAIYCMLLVASFATGVVSLWNVNYFTWTNPLIVLIIAFCFAVIFLVLIDRSMRDIATDLQSDIIVDDRIVIRVLFHKHQVEDAIKKLARQVNTTYEGNKFTLITVGLGGLSFAGLLLQELRRLKKKDFVPFPIFIEREEQADGTSEFKIAETPPSEMIVDRDVLIVDDLVSSGRTIHFLMDKIKRMGAKTVRACILVDAQNRHKLKVDIRFSGLIIPAAQEKDNYVGCGMDIHGECRELPYIGTVRSYKRKITR